MLKKNDYRKKTSKKQQQAEREWDTVAMHRNSSIFTGWPIVIADKLE
jgi:hypothetical protein